MKGRAVTSVPVIKDDVIHAGGDWRNEAVVVDGNLITSQLPNDLPQFLARILDALAGSDARAATSRPSCMMPRRARRCTTRPPW